MEEKQKAPIYQRMWFWAIMAVVVFLLLDLVRTGPISTQVLGLGGALGTTDQWEYVTQFEGDDSMTTWDFEVTAERWRITYSTWADEYKDDYFGILLYTEGERYGDGIVETYGDKSGSYEVEGAGTYYLETATTQNYKITIEKLVN